MRLRYFLSIFLVVFCLLLLSGCSTKEEATVIKFSSWGSESEVRILRPLIAEFEEKNPDIKIEFIHIPKNYFQKLHLLFASNLAPDVIFVNNINGIIYADAGLFEDLSPYLDASEKTDREDFFENSLKAFTYNDKLYALPRDVSNIVVFYNKDIFSRCGVEPPYEEWTFEDFLEKSKALVNSKSCSQKWAVGFDERAVFWLPFLWSNGGGILSEDLEKIIIAEEASVEGLEFYSDLRNKYHLAPSDAQKGSLSNSQLFKHGDIAMQISGRWSVPFFRKNLDFDWDIVPFPSSKRGSVVDVDASGWGISAGSKYKEQAWRFVEFMASEEAVKKMTSSGLIIPARVSVAKSELFLDTKQKPAGSKYFVTAIDTGIPTPANKNYQEILDILDKRIELLFSGKKQAKEVIDKELEAELSELLE